MTFYQSKLNPFVVRHRIDLIAVLGLAVFALIIFVPGIRFFAWQNLDYVNHRRFMEDLLNGMPISQFLNRVPHFLYHLLVLLLYGVIPGIHLQDAAVLVTVVFYAGTAILLYYWCELILGKPTTWRMAAVYMTVALALMLASSINLFTPTNRYMGYIAVHVYHNPTMVIVKPFAILAFGLAVRIFDARTLAKPIQFSLISATITVMCLLAKPNYIMALLPALVATALLAYARERHVHWRVLVGGMLIPAAALLVIQSVLLSGRQGIVFAPLAVFYTWDTMINPLTSNGLVLKFLLSVLFPLSVYLCFFKQAIRTFYLNLAWLVFAFGAGYTYLLAEDPGAINGNFTWSGQITLFVLFAASAAFLVERARTASNKRGRIMIMVCSAIFGLHLVSGTAWYLLYTGGMSIGDIIIKTW